MNDRLAAALSDRYRLERELGAGGMAVVYLAEDVKHHRRVALKVLREDLAASVGAVRFLREIEIAAQLQHPNILPLHESGAAAGFLYYVMPFVDGQSLRQRIARDGELPVGEAVRLLIELVDALAYAHAHGVVHRDIKPDNVMLSGRHALVTDFGVAKAISDATGGHSVTTTGMALGTPAYMAPEQATGDPHVDHRADIYSLGILAYELLTGRPPFLAATPQQTLAAHLTQQPDPLGMHRPGLSPTLDHAVLKCLEKRPADRWQLASELLAELESLGASTAGTAPSPNGLLAVRRWPRVPLITLGVVALVVGVAATVLLARDTRALLLGRAVQLTADPGLEIYPAISPDGRIVAYAGGTSARMRIYLRPVSGGRTLVLSNDSATIETEPAWSPTGEYVLFLARGGAYVASSLGGSMRQIVPPGVRRVTSATWSPDGKEIGAVRGDSLYILSADGLQQRFVMRGTELHSCDWSPAGRWMACVAGNVHYPEPGAFFANIAPSRIVLIALSDGHSLNLTDSLTFNESPRWSTDGSTLYFISNRDGPRDIYALKLARSGRVRRAVQRITTGLGVHSFSFDRARMHVAYATYAEKANLWSLAVPARPPVSADSAVQMTFANQIIEVSRSSQDGKWVVYDSNLHGNADIYRIPSGGGEPDRLTNDPVDESNGVQSPDGREFAFHSFRNGSRDVYVQAIGRGRAEQLTSTPAEECCPVWSPDGRSLAIMDYTPEGGIWVLHRDSAGRWGRPRRLLSRGLLHSWSPDGKLMAVASGGTIRASPQSERLELITVDSGTATTLYTVSDTVNDPLVGDPHWSPDGKRIYLKSLDAQGRASLWDIPVSGGRPRLLVRFDDPARPSYRPNFATDGRRFYFSINDRQSDVWVAEVNRK